MFVRLHRANETVYVGFRQFLRRFDLKAKDLSQTKQNSGSLRLVSHRGACKLTADSEEPVLSGAKAVYNDHRYNLRGHSLFRAACFDEEITERIARNAGIVHVDCNEAGFGHVFCK